MRSKCYTLSAVALLIGAMVRSAFGAAARVELTLAAEPGAPLVAQQTWVRQLGQAGVPSVRIRQGRAGDSPAIETIGGGQSPMYRVTGVLNTRGEVVLPGGRFRSGEADRVARWLADVAEKGPPDAREPVAVMGLPQSQLDALRAELAAPVDFSTQAASRGKVVRQIIERLSISVDVDAAVLAALDEDALDEELLGLARGTAMAYVLSSPGLGLLPRGSIRGPSLAIAKPHRGEASWPVGWPPEQRGPQLLPEMYSRREIHVENVSVQEVIEEIARRVNIPILTDRAALDHYDIDPAKVTASVPRGQTTYSLVLQKTLFQARLKSELRVDDAGRPLVWVTSLKAAPLEQ